MIGKRAPGRRGSVDRTRSKGVGRGASNRPFGSSTLGLQGGSPPARTPGGRDEVVWERDRTQLKRIELAFGTLPDRHVIPVAGRHNVSPATVRRWYRGQTSPRGSFVLADDHLAEICRLGDVRKAWRFLTDERQIAVGYHTFWRAWVRLPKALRDGILDNVRAMRRHQVFGKFPREGRNALWLGDSSMANTYVWVPGFQKPRRPGHVFIIEGATRLTWMAVVDEAVNAETITAAVASAIVPTRHPDGTTTGGVPHAFKMDLGRDYTARAQIEMLNRLGTVAILCDAYSPWEKGTVEAVVQTILDDLCPGLPGFVRTYADGQAKPWHPDDGPLLTFDEYARLAFDALRRYNERPHGGLGGLSPLEAWAASDLAIDWLEDDSDEALARLFLRKSEQRTISKNGIRFRGADYLEPWLADEIGRGERVTLGFAENLNLGVLGGAATGLYIFRGDEYLGVVREASDRTPEEGLELKRVRQRQVYTAKKIHRLAAKRRQEVKEQAFGRGPSSPPPEPEKPHRGRRSEARRRVAVEGLSSALLADDKPRDHAGG